MIQASHTQTVFTVTQLTRSIKTLLEGEYRFIRVNGEISNLMTPFSGHSYFSLKDSHAQIRAVLFKNQKRYLGCQLENGQQVTCFGRISVYEPRGEYQFIVDTIEQSGTGNLQLEFEKLKRKLSNEGLFSEELKKKIPPYPAKVAIITSPTGAALRDFLKIAQTRESHVHLQILPVKVQGTEAAPEIIKAIQLANDLNDIDIIVLCRGGGSIEDLWAFNEEEVGRAINKSKIPIVTGIGHEIDFTIADFCADFRCPTPTGVAAEILPDVSEVQDHLTRLKRRIFYRLTHKLKVLDNIIRNNIKVLGTIDRIVENLDLRLNLSRTYLLQAIGSTLAERENRLQHGFQKLGMNAPHVKLELREQKLKLLLIQLVNHMKSQLKKKESDFGNVAILLNSVSPLATLARGYSIVTKVNPQSGQKEVLSKVSETVTDDNLEILLHKGSLDCKVTKVNP